MLKKVLFLVGPTAVGKTAVAVGLAKRIPLEVISCDSMQIYKEINIASSKPAGEILRKVKHHLINVVSLKDEYDVARFRWDALRALNKIIKKNKLPLFVGGSGLYMSVVLDGIFKGAQKNSKIRKFLEKQAKDFGNLYLYNKLKKVDSLASSKIHPNDLKRIIRALEVFELTKKPISALHKQRKGIWEKFDIKVFGLIRPRNKLYEIIDKRVDEMFKQGLPDEMKNCLKRPLSRTAAYCLGIREIKGFLEGKYNLEEAKRLIKQNSRRYAKRQLTWLRRDKRINWIEINLKETPGKVAQKIISQL